MATSGLPPIGSSSTSNSNDLSCRSFRKVYKRSVFYKVEPAARRINSIVCGVLNSTSASDVQVQQLALTFVIRNSGCHIIYIVPGTFSFDVVRFSYYLTLRTSNNPHTTKWRQNFFPPSRVSKILLSAFQKVTYFNSIKAKSTN